MTLSEGTGPGAHGAAGVAVESGAGRQAEAFSWRFVTPLLVSSTLNPVNSSLIATALVPIAHALGGVGRADGELGIGALRRYLFENGCRRAAFAHGQVFRSLMASPRSRQELIAALEPIAAVVCNYTVSESALLCATTAPGAPVRIMEGSDR